MDIKKILVPTDFSKNSEAAFGAAVGLARKFGANIHVLHVVEPAAAAPLALAGILPQGEILDRLESSAEEMMQAFLKKHGKDAATESLVAIGTPSAEVARYAKRNRIDLIVMATHGRTGLAHLVMGSVAERVVQTAGIPVLTIPTKAKKK